MGTTTTTTSATTGTATTGTATTAGRRRRRRHRLAAGAASLLALGALATAVAPAAVARPGGGSAATASTSAERGSDKGGTDRRAARSVNKAYTVTGASLLSIETTYRGVIRDNTGATVNQGKALALRSGCTAFSVSSDGYLVTAGHCVDPDNGSDELIKAAAAIEAKSGTWTVGDRPATVQELTTYGAEHWSVDADVSVRVRLPESSKASSRDKDDMVGARVLSYKPFEEEDVALLKVGAENLPVLELSTDQELREGDEVVSAGFASTSAANTDAGAPTFKDGTISSKRTEGNGKMPVLETSASLNPGMSSGPTVDADGRVVGVNSGFMRTAQAFNYVRPASLINEMLRREGVENKLSPSDIAFRKAIEAYNEGEFSTVVDQIDEVLEAWPGHEQATRLREGAVKAGGTAGAGSSTDSTRSDSASTTPAVSSAAGSASAASTPSVGSDLAVVLIGAAFIILVAAGGITAVVLIARRSGPTGRPAGAVPAGPAPAGPIPTDLAPVPGSAAVPAGMAPVVVVPGATAAQPPVADPYRTDEIPVVPATVRSSAI